MPRPIALLTAQWADLPFTTVCELASGWGYDGLEIACWGDHFDINRAVNEPGYVEERKEILAKYNLKAWALANHLVGQAVCDNPIDERHQGILPSRLWGDGEPEGRRSRSRQNGDPDGRRLHRVVDLAHRRNVPSGTCRDDRAWLPGLC